MGEEEDPSTGLWTVCGFGSFIDETAEEGSQITTVFLTVMAKIYQITI